MNNKSINLIIEDVKRDVYAVLNRDGLPISILSMIITSIANDVNGQANTIIAQEKAQLEKIEE